MKKYDIKFLNSGEWINNITGVSVNGVEYKSGLVWGDSKDRYAVYKSDNNIDVKSNILNLPIKISVNYNRGLFLKNYFSWINTRKPVNFY